MTTFETPATTPGSGDDGPRDRDEVFLEYTKSICPVCKRMIDAEVNIRDDKVYLRKRCPRPRGVRGAGLRRRAGCTWTRPRFNKPGTIPLQTSRPRSDGCPSDCGLCPEHKQHACLGDHRGQHGLQPGLPDLLRRLRPPARRLLDHPRAVRRHARRVRRGRGRAGGGDVLRRRAHHPQAHPRLHRPGPGPADPQRSTSTPTASVSPPTSGSSPSWANATGPASRSTSTCSSTASTRRTHREIRGTRPARASSSGRWTTAPRPG